MKTSYSYITLRYVHDVVTGEFANVGVVLYAPEARFLRARFTTSYERLNAMFLKIDHPHFRALMRYLIDEFDEKSEELRESLERPLKGIEDLAKEVLPRDDSSLQWSPAGAGFCENNLEQTSQRLFTRLVEQYADSGEQESRTDEEIARPFKTSLEKRKVAERVREKKIRAKDYEYDFQFGWKNSAWHLYEPVSFDLVEPNSIVEKANKWLGRGTALQDSAENFKIYFLLGEPKEKKKREAFEHARHLLEKIPGDKELVREADVEKFSESVAENIERHSEKQR
jgi:hypothetical protein